MTIDDAHERTVAAIDELGHVNAIDINETETGQFWKALHALYDLDEALAQRSSYPELRQPHLEDNNDE